MRLAWLAILTFVACSGDSPARNDTAVADDLPAAGGPNRPPPSTWDRRLGDLFAVHASSGVVWLVNPAYGRGQVLDTLTADSWVVGQSTLELIGGGRVVGTATIESVRFDSTCAGWPTAAVSPMSTPWTVGFPAGRVVGIAYDSLPDLSPSDSTAQVRLGALAASRLPDDTLSAFRGRPFIVRQASRFRLGSDTTLTVFEVVRLVPQEANPLEERLVIITERTGADSTSRTVYHEREVGLEETTASFEILAVLRVVATGELALLVRREREGGFVLGWIQRQRSGRWRVQWQGAVDGC